MNFSTLMCVFVLFLQIGSHQCKEVHCPALDVTLPGLSRLQNITYDTASTDGSGLYYPLGSNVTFYCNHHPFTATCNENEMGLWHVNRIIDQGCLGFCPPFNVQSGQVSYDRARIFENGYLFDTTAIVRCNAGALMFVNGVPFEVRANTCNRISNWGQVEDCHQVECPPLSLSNGEIHYSRRIGSLGYSRDTGASFSCHNGYNLNGARSVTCQIDNPPNSSLAFITYVSWSSSPPTCEKVDCVPVSLIKGTVNYNTTVTANGGYPSGTVASLTCNPGYYRTSDPMSTMCTASLNWNPEPDTACIQVQFLHFFGVEGDSPGSDIGSSNRTVQECASLCFNTTRCKGFAFNPSEQRCTMKNGLTYTAYTPRNILLYFKLVGLEGQNDSVPQYMGYVGFKGESLHHNIHLSYRTPEECADWCDNTISCLGFVVYLYGTVNGLPRCQLKDELKFPTPFPNREGFLTYFRMNESECASNPCLNGGTCVYQYLSYTCSCNTFFTGLRCEFRNDSVYNSPVGWTGPQPALYRSFDTREGLVLMEGFNECNADAFVTGKLGYAWSVDRTSKQWIDVGIHTEACMTRPETCGSAGGAVSFWINVVNCTGFQYLGGLITTENAGPGLRIFCHAPSGLLGYLLSVNSEGFFATANKPSGWFHVVMNYLGPNEGEGIRIYNNGIEVRNDTTTGTGVCILEPCLPDGQIVIGRAYTRMSTLYVSLEVDELAFFNTALSQDEITMLSQHTDTK